MKSKAFDFIKKIRITTPGASFHGQTPEGCGKQSQEMCLYVQPSHINLGLLHKRSVPSTQY